MSLLLLLLFPVSVFASFPNYYPRARTSTFEGYAGDRLIITPYIESGKIELARKLSKVPPLAGDVESYAGFVTVDKERDSNMFFWFFPAARNAESSPVTLWLQGGPGATSLYGLFTENGPYELTPDNRIKVRDQSWTLVTSMLYIDNPVGTGFSYTRDGYSRNETHVGANLLVAVKQILQLFPEVSSNPFFVTGESYAGKYVPALAYAIHKHNGETEPKINFQGLAIGNALVDPGNQLHYGEYLYQLGLLDTAGKEQFASMEDECRSLISQQKWKDAFFCFDRLLNGDMIDEKTFFFNATGFTYYFNYLHDSEPPEGSFDKLWKSETLRKSIHVGDAVWNNGTVVEENLMEDVMKSTAPWLSELLEHYRVLLYNGQLDIIVAYPLTEAYLKKLRWSASDDYRKAPRHLWKVGKELAGYVKVAGRLTEVLVRNAGHMAPSDQPKWCFDLIARFLRNKPFF